MITCHEAEFETIDGYHFKLVVGIIKNDNVIKNLYGFRLKLKGDNNTAGVVIKLLINSMYQCMEHYY